MNGCPKVLLKSVNQNSVKTLTCTQARMARGPFSGGTNLQLGFPGPQILGCGHSHCDDSNQLGVFHFQPLLEVPQELGETFLAAFLREQMRLREHTAWPTHQRGNRPTGHASQGRGKSQGRPKVTKGGLEPGEGGMSP